jgi:hypothetical protein
MDVDGAGKAACNAAFVPATTINSATRRIGGVDPVSRNPTPRLDQIRALREARFARMEAMQKEAEKAAAPEKQAPKAAPVPKRTPEAPSPAEKTEAKATKPKTAKKEPAAKKARANKAAAPKAKKKAR